MRDGTAMSFCTVLYVTHTPMSVVLWNQIIWTT
jgi:hypothetical protein